MRIIAVASQKGGSGKSTLAGHLAVQASRNGLVTGLLDTDPQGSLMDWAAEREDVSPHVAASTAQALDTALDGLRRQGCRLVVIDTPPAITRAIETVVHRADLVVIPTRPSPHDLRAAGATVDLVEHIGKPLVFVVNAAAPRARLTGEAAIALSQHGTVAPVVIHNRQDFAWSMIDGRTVLEAAPKGKSAAEIQGLWDYVQDRLTRLPLRLPLRSVSRERPAFGKAQINGSTDAVGRM